MKRFFQQDSVLSALVAGVGTLLVYCLLLWIGLTIAGESVAAHLRWFGGAFILLILVLRAYAKTRQHITATKTLIVLFFLSFVAFMFLLFATHSISLR